MIGVSDLEALRFPVGWTTLLVGRERHLIEAAAVRRFADARAGSDASEEVIAILGADDDAEIDRALRAIAGREVTDRDTEARKWRAALLARKLDELPASPLYALLQLTEFWASFDYPTASPHVVQGRGDDRNAAEYYTAANYQSVLAAHQRWLAVEVRALQGGPA